jgi:hypothetical protein
LVQRSFILKEANMINDKLEKAEGSIPAGDGALALIKFACLLLIGVIILSGVAASAVISPNGTFYNLYISVRRNISFGYAILADLMITLSVGLVTKYFDLW